MYKIKCLLVSWFVLGAMAAFAQQQIQVQGSSPDLHLSHTVAAKETWFSIGRYYNLTPKEIAAYNKSNLTEVLKLGQVLKIPLTVDNFSQDGQRAADEVFVPLYYTVQPKEWMYRISQNHNKVPVETLESWNNVKNDQLRAGMSLVVGYLKVRTGQSPLASRGTKKIATQTSPPVAKNEKPAEAVAKKPEEKTPDAGVITDVKVTTTDKPATQPVTQPATQPVTQTTTPAQPKTVIENTPVSNTETWGGYKGGYFKNSYAEKGTNTTGNAGIFRSTSGWKDGKYYALINEVPTGTIIKVTFPGTNKSVFAKVLGPLPEMRESMGLKLRLSDAAAAELGADIGKFYVDVKY
jgi:LysM repeat protein